MILPKIFNARPIPYYESENGVLYCGDCLEIMPTLGTKVDLVLTDPPYGTTQNKWDAIIPFDKMWKSLESVVKLNSTVCLFGSEPFSSILRVSNVACYKYDWFTIKSKPTGFLNAKKQPLRTVESISVFCYGSTAYYPQGLTDCEKLVTRTNRGNYGDCSKTTIQKKTGYPRQHIEIKAVDGKHPTQKPVALMEYLINTYTLEGDTVLDFTIGSGTTAVAAINTGRKFIGIEMSREYCEIAKQRIIEAEKEKGSKND